MELNIEIKPNQDYEQGSFHFEPDSSPAAYEYYKLIYPSDGFLKQNFNFDNPVFSLSSGRKNGFNYKNAAKTCNNRLFVLLKGTNSMDINGVKYFEPNYKLGGECDFNFNKMKYESFQKIINRDMKASECDKENARKHLENCSQMHHSLLNFSLMQVMGNLQCVKGRNYFDRFDTFISKLNDYYLLPSVYDLKSSCKNKSMLQAYLKNFNDVYGYCSEHYLIHDKGFVDRIVAEGKLPISNVEEITRYMKLAEDYWCIKDSIYKEKM